MTVEGITLNDMTLREINPREWMGIREQWISTKYYPDTNDMTAVIEVPLSSDNLEQLLHDASLFHKARGISIPTKGNRAKYRVDEIDANMPMIKRLISESPFTTKFEVIFNYSANQKAPNPPNINFTLINGVYVSYSVFLPLTRAEELKWEGKPLFIGTYLDAYLERTNSFLANTKT